MSYLNELDLYIRRSSYLESCIHILYIYILYYICFNANTKTLIMSTWEMFIFMPVSSLHSMLFKCNDSSGKEVLAVHVAIIVRVLLMHDVFY